MDFSVSVQLTHDEFVQQKKIIQERAELSDTKTSKKGLIQNDIIYFDNNETMAKPATITSLIHLNKYIVHWPLAGAAIRRQP